MLKLAPKINNITTNVNKGKLLDILNIKPCANLYKWIENSGLLDEDFAVLIRITLSKHKNFLLYCKCHINFSKDEPFISAKVFPKIREEHPNEIKGLKIFELNDNDLVEAI